MLLLTRSFPVMGLERLVMDAAKQYPPLKVCSETYFPCLFLSRSTIRGHSFGITNTQSLVYTANIVGYFTDMHGDGQRISSLGCSY